MWEAGIRERLRACGGPLPFTRCGEGLSTASLLDLFEIQVFSQDCFNGPLGNGCDLRGWKEGSKTMLCPPAYQPQSTEGPLWRPTWEIPTPEGKAVGHRPCLSLGVPS
jgi:hypothetical protein